MDSDKNLATARKNLRIAVAMNETSFAEVARLAGLSRNAVSQFVTGRTTLSYANMLNVCAALNIPIALLHRPDGMSEARLRLHRILEAMPDHKISAALGLAAEAACDPLTLADPE
jgi:transcriptional regulator with XRE-family HTH domain